MHIKKSLVLPAAIAAMVGAAFFSGHGDFVPFGISQAVTPDTPAMAAAAPARALPDFTSLVEAAGPAVVNISTVEKARRPQPGSGLTPQDPLDELFRQFGGAPAEAAPVQAVGSGFIVSADGYILTNAHVVADAREVSVKLTDKSEYKAKVVGFDERTDVALIKIDASGLPTVKLGSSSKVKVGEWVAAIGSPFGFENSVTAGIVSAKARILPEESYVPFLQTDVAINPGNSGGPLFNMNGEVIGINSQIYSRTGGYMGLSFAIPIETAMKVQDDLRRYGKVSRGRIGVAIQPVNKELAESFGLKERQGALITSVEPDSPAGKAGIIAGDIVLAVNDRNIEQPADLAREIGETKPGQNVKLKLWRNGSAREINATVSEPKPEQQAAVAPAAAGAAQSSGKLGLALRPLTGDERKQLGIAGGLAVEGATGPAARAGIQRGDIVLAVNNETVQTIEQVRRLIEKSHANVALLVQREGNRLYIPVKVG